MSTFFNKTLNLKKGFKSILGTSSALIAALAVSSSFLMTPGTASAGSSCLVNKSSVYSIDVKYKNGRYGSVAPRTKKCNISKIRSSGFYEIPYSIVQPWAWTDHLGRVEVQCRTSYSHKSGLNLYVSSAALYYKLRNKSGYTYLRNNPTVYPKFYCGSGLRY